uniref:Uncharacterized protein n=1 Tax=Arundo donax TaxID=35708 RepID=A0A0A9CTF1_ARUDO
MDFFLLSISPLIRFLHCTLWFDSDDCSTEELSSESMLPDTEISSTARGELRSAQSLLSSLLLLEPISGISSAHPLLSLLLLLELISGTSPARSLLSPLLILEPISGNSSPHSLILEPISGTSLLPPSDSAHWQLLSLLCLSLRSSLDTVASITNPPLSQSSLIVSSESLLVFSWSSPAHIARASLSEDPRRSSGLSSSPASFVGARTIYPRPSPSSPATTSLSRAIKLSSRTVPPDAFIH